MATVDDDAGTSEQAIAASTWIMTESHEFLQNMLSYLPALELVKCARVCHQWKKEVDLILRSREQIGWVSYNYNTAREGGSDHILGHFGENLDECVQSLWSIPYHVLMFTELVRCTDYTIGTRQRGHFSMPGCGFGRQQKWQEIHHVLDLIRDRLPQQCNLLSIQTSGTVGTYRNMQLAGESEGDGAATAILFPKMQGVNIEHLKVTRKSLTEGSLREALGIAQTPDIKCVLLFGFGNTPAAQFLATRLQTSFRETYGWDPVIAGAIGDDLLTKQDLTKEEIMTKVIGVTFSGPNVHTASVLLDSNVCSKEHVKLELQKLKKVGLCEKKSVAFMFACVGRGVDFHEEENAESEAFHELFPNTPLFGFFGNGEIGCENFACGKAMTSEEDDGDSCMDKLPEIMHGYTTIICLLSFGPAT
ncbi:F-box only protein 22-like [Amphiura filiformis]|uniref:F-box only protein 22-like n=1 Tax=Amphiura filiformis TaxID=82378 RepID=UPI003B2227D2